MVDGILIGLGVLCVAYFIVIVVYAGIGTSFAFIWLFFAALLLKRHIRHSKGRARGKCPTCVVTRADHAAWISLQVDSSSGRYFDNSCRAILCSLLPGGERSREGTLVLWEKLC